MSARRPTTLLGSSIILVCIILSATAALAQVTDALCSVRTKRNPAIEKKSIAHEMLSREGELWSVGRREIALLDAVVGAASRRAAPRMTHLRSRDTAERNAEARRVLMSIDTALSIAGFLSPVSEIEIPLGRTLRPQPAWSADSLERVYANHHNRRRLSFRGARTPVHLADDRSLALVTLAIAKRLSLPIRLYRVPDRFFLAWTFGPDDMIIWDPRLAFAIDPARAILDYDVARPHIEQGVYMRPLDERLARSAFLTQLGMQWGDAGCAQRAVAVYREAWDLDHLNHLAGNGLAWNLLRDSTSPHRFDEAQSLVTEILRLFGPESGWRELPQRSAEWVGMYLDTRAAARSEKGEFTGALADQLRAVTLLGPQHANACRYRSLVEHYQQQKPYLSFTDPCPKAPTTVPTTVTATGGSSEPE